MQCNIFEDGSSTAEKMYHTVKSLNGPFFPMAANASIGLRKKKNVHSTYTYTHLHSHTHKQINSMSLYGVWAVHYPSSCIERGPLVVLIYGSNHDHEIEHCFLAASATLINYGTFSSYNPYKQN